MKILHEDMPISCLELDRLNPPIDSHFLIGVPWGGFLIEPSPVKLSICLG